MVVVRPCPWWCPRSHPTALVLGGGPAAGLQSCPRCCPMISSKVARPCPDRGLFHSSVPKTVPQSCPQHPIFDNNAMALAGISKNHVHPLATTTHTGAQDQGCRWPVPLSLSPWPLITAATKRRNTGNDGNEPVTITSASGTEYGQRRLSTMPSSAEAVFTYPSSCILCLAGSFCTGSPRTTPAGPTKSAMARHEVVVWTQMGPNSRCAASRLLAAPPAPVTLARGDPAIPQPHNPCPGNTMAPIFVTPPGTVRCRYLPRAVDVIPRTMLPMPWRIVAYGNTAVRVPRRPLWGHCGANAPAPGH